MRAAVGATRCCSRLFPHWRTVNSVHLGEITDPAPDLDVQMMRGSIAIVNEMEF
jgi:hypothetical protein